jgi:hypothetical protein
MIVPDAMLARLAAAAAVAAGVLRAVDSFAFEFLDERSSDTLFLATDICLLFALIGIYGFRGRALGWIGLVGFAVAIVGIVLTRSAGENIDNYIYGAGTVAVGMAILSIGFLLFGGFPVWCPVLWIVALIAGALDFLWENDLVFELAGTAFGLGFVLAGIELLLHPPEAAPRTP